MLRVLSIPLRVGLIRRRPAFALFPLHQPLLQIQMRSYGLKKPPKRNTAIVEDLGSEDGEEDEETDSDGFGPVRPEKERLTEPYDLALIKRVISDMRGTDFVAIDISNKVNWVNYFVVVTGRSGAHINSMAKALVYELKRRRPGNYGVSQKGNDFWVIVESGDIVVNLFTEEAREDYDLERVWTLRRDEKRTTSKDFDQEFETKWQYDDDDLMDSVNDPEEEATQKYLTEQANTPKGSRKPNAKPKRDKTEERPRGKKNMFRDAKRYGSPSSVLGR